MAILKKIITARMTALLGDHSRRCSLKTKKVAIENKTKENRTKDQWTLCMFTDVTAKQGKHALLEEYRIIRYPYR